MNKILTERGQVKHLTELFNVSRPTVIKALKGEGNNELAIRIRKTALDLGGQVKGEEKVTIIKR